MYDAKADKPWTVLYHHRDWMTDSDKNNPNYPQPYETTIPNGTPLGLDSNWWHVKFFRHLDNNGFGAQIAIGLTAQNRMLYRTSNGLAWGPWIEVANKGDTGGLWGEVNSLKTSVSNGKASIASAITDKGVSTSATASFAQMAANIRAIPTAPQKLIKTLEARRTVTAGEYVMTSFAAPQHSIASIYFNTATSLQGNGQPMKTLDLVNTTKVIQKGSSYDYVYWSSYTSAHVRFSFNPDGNFTISNYSADGDRLTIGVYINCTVTFT